MIIPYEADENNAVTGDNWIIMTHRFNESYSFLFPKDMININTNDMGSCRYEMNEYLNSLGFSADFSLPLENGGLCVFRLRRLEGAVH